MTPLRHRLGLLALLSRSSSVLPLAPGIAALIVANTVLRGHPWDHEWGWTLYQAGFVTVFLGPLCAGIGAWDGAQLARAQATIESAGRSAAARAAACAVIVAGVATIYLGLLIVLGAVLKVDGILGWPTPSDVSPIVGVVTLCAAWAGIGVAIGYRWRSPALAPLSAAAAFALTLVLHLTQPFLIKVGGATASIAFLQPRWSIQLGQSVFFLGIAATALLGPPHGRGVRRPVAHHLALLAAPAVAVIAAGYLITAHGLELVPRHQPLACRGQHPQICVAAPYRDRIDWPRPYLEPYLAALDDLGIDAPTTFVQGWDRQPGQGSVPDELLRGHPPIAGPLGSVGPGGSAVLGAYLPDFCDLYQDPAVNQAYDAVSLWLTSVTDPTVLHDPTAPAPLRSGDRRAKAAYLQAAFTELSTCHR